MIGQAAKPKIPDAKENNHKPPFFPRRLSLFAFGIGLSLAVADLFGYEPFNSKSVSAKNPSSSFRSHSTYYRHK